MSCYMCESILDICDHCLRGKYEEVAKEIQSKDEQIKILEEALEEIEKFQIMCTQDMKLPMEIARQALAKLKEMRKEVK